MRIQSSKYKKYQQTNPEFPLTLGGTPTDANYDNNGFLLPEIETYSDRTGPHIQERMDYEREQMDAAVIAKQKQDHDDLMAAKQGTIYETPKAINPNMQFYYNNAPGLRTNEVAKSNFAYRKFGYGTGKNDIDLGGPWLNYTAEVMADPNRIIEATAIVGGAITGGSAIAPYLSGSLAMPLPFMGSVPGATYGNLLNSYFASDFLVNRAPNIPGQIERGEYTDAAVNIGFGALDLLGLGLSNISRITNAATSEIKSMVTNIPSAVSKINFNLPSKATKSDFKNVLSDSKYVLTQINEKVTSMFDSSKHLDEAHKFFNAHVGDPATQKKITDGIEARIHAIQSHPGFDPSMHKHLVENLFTLKDQLLNYKAAAKEVPISTLVSNNLKQWAALGFYDTKLFPAARWGSNNENVFDLSGVLERLQPILKSADGVSPGHVLTADHKVKIANNTINRGALRGVGTERYFNGATWVARTNDVRTKPMQKWAAWHEDYHSYMTKEAMVELGYYDFVKNLMNPPTKKLFEAWKSLHSQGKSNNEIADIMGKTNAYLGYLSDPSEVGARIMEMRGYFNIKPGQFVSYKDAKKMMDHIESLPFKERVVDARWFETFDRRSNTLAQYFNEFAAIIPGAVVLGQTTKTKKTETYALGGYIKTNKHYLENALKSNYTGFVQTDNLTRR